MLQNSESQTVGGLCYRTVTVRLLVDYATEQRQPDCWWIMLQNSDSQTVGGLHKIDSQTVGGLCYRTVTAIPLVDNAT